MTSAHAAMSPLSAPIALPATLQGSRRDLSDLLRQICDDTRAESYMLLDMTVRAGEQARIVACNWIFDAIDMVGIDRMTRLARQWVRSTEKAQLDGDDAELLLSQGHAELIGVPLRAGSRRYTLILSASARGALVERAFARVELVCSYALSMFTSRQPQDVETSPLSERERECIFWVAEGKTTEEVGVILGVSPSTVNTYLGSVMQKLGARNRALAIATAIRQDLI